MATQYQALRGMHDLLPDTILDWHYIERKIRHLMNLYGYSEIRTPIAEYTDLFSRGIGSGTDIIEKEMYTFSDRNDELLSLRPEMTAGVLRALLQHGLLFNQTQRVWSMGPVFRYERPQKGRYRQFNQLSVEAFGMPQSDIDAELILMTARLWKILGLSEFVKLELNTVGSQQSRIDYRNALVEYLNPLASCLDEDSRNRLTSNPLRILDSKNTETQKVLKNAPVLFDYLDKESSEHFIRLKHILDEVEVEYTINPRLVRGLDYYNRTVFEWTTDILGAQSTVCGGGRYDDLITLLGGKSTPAVGFAIGLERLILMLDSLSLVPDSNKKILDIMIVSKQASGLLFALKVCEKIRELSPNIRIQMSDGGGFKGQLKRAYQSSAKLVGLFDGEKPFIVVQSLNDGLSKEMTESEFINYCQFIDVKNVV